MTTSTPRTICDLMENAQETDATLDLDKMKIRRWYKIQIVRHHPCFWVHKKEIQKHFFYEQISSKFFVFILFSVKN